MSLTPPTTRCHSSPCTAACCPWPVPTPPCASSPTPTRPTWTVSGKQTWCATSSGDCQWSHDMSGHVQHLKVPFFLPYCRFLGTSGQNISDIFKYSSMDDYLEILEWTLLAGHISPTAPDTLGMVRAEGLSNGGLCQGFPPPNSHLPQAVTRSTNLTRLFSLSALTSTSVAMRLTSSPSCSKVGLTAHPDPVPGAARGLLCLTPTCVCREGGAAGAAGDGARLQCHADCLPHQPA